jgi:PRTRC genetic system ThiF family protein
MRTLKKDKPAVHIVPKELLQPYNPVTVNLIGAGGTGGQVLTALARMNHALNALGHAGLSVIVFDDDTVDTANLGRQLFTTAELGQFKSVALINRINRFFGTNWRAETIRYDKAALKGHALASAVITISCVDTVDARYEVAGILKWLSETYRGREQVKYWMDFGNGRSSGQVLLSTLTEISQPASKQYRPTGCLPLVTDEFQELLTVSERNDNTPSCSLAEALTKQDLFINSALANCGASLLWQMFREGVLFNRGFFLNLQEFRTQPIKIA